MRNALDRFGPFSFDRQRMTLSMGGSTHTIGSRGAALLAALVDANGGVVGKDALMQAAWPGTAVEESNLTVQIAALRKAMGKRPDGGDWIATVPRAGYRLVAEDASPRARRPSIAVLPFSNLSGDPSQDYLSDGIVEDLITALSRFRTFAVIARNSSVAYKNRAVDIRDVARELGVRYLLEGSVRRAGDRVRVTAQLIEGTTGEHLWAEKFDGPFLDILDFQDHITASVIGLIEPEIRKAEIERTRYKRPENLDAWDLYLRALPMVYSANVPGYTDAIALLERALAIDPSYAPALTLAAWAHEKRKTFGGSAPAGDDDVAIAFAYAERALAIDRDDALTLALLGWMRILFHRDYDGIAFVDRAVTLNPHNLAVLQFAGTANLNINLEEAIRISTHALELNPTGTDNYMSLNLIAQAHLDMERWDDAAVWAKRSIEANSAYLYSHLTLACAYAMLDRDAEAKAEVAIVLRIQPEMSIALRNKQTPFRTPERRRLWEVAQRRAGMPEGDPT